MSFTEIKPIGFCEWWRTESAPEYTNFVSSLGISVLALVYLYHSASHYHQLYEFVYVSLFWNGIASAIFHYTLWSLPGALDVVTMLQTGFALLFVIHYTLQDMETYPQLYMSLKAIFVGASSLLIVLSIWKGSNIDFNWLLVLLILTIFLLVLREALIIRNRDFNICIILVILEFMVGLSAWVSTEPWCETNAFLRHFFFFHSVWHLLAADSICRLTRIQQRIKQGDF